MRPKILDDFHFRRGIEDLLRSWDRGSLRLDRWEESLEGNTVIVVLGRNNILTTPFLLLLLLVLPENEREKDQLLGCFSGVN